MVEPPPPARSMNAAALADEGIRVGYREVHRVAGIVGAHAGIDREGSLRRHRRTVVADKCARGAHRDGGIIEGIRVDSRVDQCGQRGCAAIVCCGEIAACIRAEHGQSGRRQRIVRLRGDAEDHLALNARIAIGVHQVRQIDDDAVVVRGKQGHGIGDLCAERCVFGRARPGSAAAVIDGQRRRGADAGCSAILGEHSDSQHPVGVESGHAVDQRTARAAGRRRRSAGARVIHDLHRQFGGGFTGKRHIRERHRSPGLPAAESHAFFDREALRVGFTG